MRCVNCENQPVLDRSDDPRNVSEEFRSVGIETRPEALIGRSLSLDELRTLWLPRGHYHAAPHLVTDEAGQHRLVWMSRSDIETTGACIVTTDARRLLTHTLPQTNSCAPSAKPRLTLADVEMYSSSPQPMVISANGAGTGGIFATGLTAQKSAARDLYFCAWSERMRKPSGNAADCHLLKENKDVFGREMGAFQYSPTIRRDRQLFFVRDIATTPSSNAIVDFFERARGNPHSPEGNFLVVDVAEKPAGGLERVTINHTPFDIEDDYDPMVALSFAKDDYRFLSLVSSDERASVYLTDFNTDKPRPRPVETWVGGAKLDLHSSWVRRPVLIVETPDAAAAKTKLIFSRARVAPARETTDSLTLEALVFERDTSASASEPFRLARSASCQIAYTFPKAIPDRTCRRSFSPDRPMRPSPAALMQASQLLAGRVTASNEQALVFADACLDSKPIVLDRVAVSRDGIGTLAATLPTAQQAGVQRQVECEPLTSREQIARELSGVGKTATGR